MNNIILRKASTLAILGMLALAGTQESLALRHLDIDVTEPGTMGDLILAEVENFADVESLRLSGRLNADDFETIKRRLTGLKEIDMTDLYLTAIPDNLFSQKESLEKAVLPKVLTSIGVEAFGNCYALKEVNLPSGLTDIGYGAFINCFSLEETILPEGFESLGKYAFSQCTSLKRLYVPSTLAYIPGCAFSGAASLSSVEFSEGLQTIDEYAFEWCHSLESIVFPSTLREIGVCAFYSAEGLKEIAFNEGLYRIGDNAFSYCISLEEVTLPGTLVLCNESPFDYCDNLRQVTCLSVEPPYMTDQIPYGCDMTGRELRVPAISLNVYKQTAGWDLFPTITSIDHLPDVMTVLGEIRLALPDELPADYKPDLSLANEYRYGWWDDHNFGALTVTGEGTLSIKDFSTVWSPYAGLLYYWADRSMTDCSLVNRANMRADNVSVRIEMPNDVWEFVQFPFDVKVSDIIPVSDGDTSFAVYRYDGAKRAAGDTSETWVRLKGDDILSCGEGHIIQTSRYKDNYWQDSSELLVKAINNGNKNKIFRSEDVTIELTDHPAEFAHNRGWNLIGNPYPAHYDTRMMSFTAPVTAWDDFNRTYVAYSPADDAYILRPGESFFVQCTAGQNSITFAAEGRQIDRFAEESVAWRKAPSFAANRHVLNITLSDGRSEDRTRVVINEDAALSYECDKDAGKFLSTSPDAPQIMTAAAGVKYAINERPLAEGDVDMPVRITAEGMHTINLQGAIEGYEILLEDMKEDKTVALSEDCGYAFHSEGKGLESRFMLHIRKAATSVDEISGAESASDAFGLDGLRKNDSKGIVIRDGKKSISKK